MEITRFNLPKGKKELRVAALGDIQWTGKEGVTGKDQLKWFVDYTGERGYYYIGLGDYIDPMSPSNRRRLAAAGLYDTAMEVLWNKCLDLNGELFENYLKPTKGRWLAVGEGHHFNEYGGRTSDQELCKLLDAPFIGTSGIVHIPQADLGIYHHHGKGGGSLPGSGLNTLYHMSAGLPGSVVYLMGHNTKLAATRLSRPYPVWKKLKLDHIDVFLVNTGGFSRSNVVGHRVAGIPRGDYAEQGMMPPSPLNSATIEVQLKLPKEHPFYIRATV